MQHRPSLVHVHSQTLKYSSMDIVQSCWQPEPPKPQGSLSHGEATHKPTLCHPRASSCEGIMEGDEFGEATIVAKQQLELQSSLGSCPITNTAETQHSSAASLDLLPVTAGSCPEPAPLCHNPAFTAQKYNHEETEYCSGWGFLDNVISSLTCYLSKGRKQMREAV